VDRAHVVPVETFRPAAAIHSSSCSRGRRPRCSARSDRISQPSPPGVRWAGQPGEEAAQHAAVRIVDGVFDRRTGAGRHPRRIAHHQRRAAVREQVGLLQFDLLVQLEAGQVFARAAQGALVLVGGDDLATPRCASTADSTPVPTPMSNASELSFGSGASATSCTYSPRTGENTP
jgi:hypothetical protein